MRAVSFIGFGGLAIGVAVAAIADVFPAHRSELQRWGGSLLIGSVALLGLTLTFV
ncbi:MAG TPA: hypothetical protein VNF99_10620 [Stellaceae bacterium]|nr:hypothetical protein [Stellaceae bacterium]